MKFDDFSKMAKSVVVGAGGGRIFRGAVVRYLKGLDIQRCLDYIHENRDLLDFWGGKEWGILKKFVKDAKIEDPEKEFVALLSKYRPDIMDVVINEPGGKEWLAGQIAKLKARLG